MTRDEILALANEAGITFVNEFGVASATAEWLERFAALVAAAERKACVEACRAQARALKEDGLFSACRGALSCSVAIRRMEP